ncbi:cysteine-tryptophan domain-containing zinc finger protein 7 isoform X3 [Hevea brasiliensis]|uniref:cysteine-tryptophan domain-containing zinc finger protein 7 isoform X3 n=1 Tax=Hevea brasiliensis TaxID=3981 RepID=UPI0025FAE40F|nr:cysteine-tryptophan domain-containing zinc finger protein 7 isoform X3 [Hevea brasiliensis]
MISLGRRDARKELGLGFGVGREMEDTELEEGEACSDHNNNDDVYEASMDPDIALSYIDEKLQDVLGHFQKDFEGGVSAENLGAKFGGYGSFLPAYQRSPVWSYPRTPPKVQHYNSPRSPNNSQLEGVHRGSVSSSTVPQSVRLEPASSSATSLTASKASSSIIVSVIQEAGLSATNIAKEHALRHESVNRKSVNLPDRKMFKVRIKVGSDNLSTQKNAAIYSGLGLDVSPSSSLDDSPSGSEGMSHGPQDSPFKSPAHILRIMTSFPVHGGLLLSPLPGDLIHLIEKEKLHKGSGSLHSHTVDIESSGIIVNGSDSLKGDGKILGEKKIRSERNEISSESKNENNKDSWSGIVVLPKVMDLDTLAFEELVSNTLKLPLVSSSSSVSDSAKGLVRASNTSREAYKGVMRDKGFSDLTKEEPLGLLYTHEDALVENPKATSAGKIWDDKKASSLDSGGVYPRKDGNRIGEKPYDSVKSDSNISKGLKAVSSELTDTPKQKADQKVTSHEKEGTKFPSGKERSFSEGKKKLKDSLTGGSSLVVKNKKSSYADDCPKGELEDSKSQKNTTKPGDRYRDFFGDIELDQEEKQMSPLEMSYEDRLKASDIGEKGTHFSNNALKERSSDKKIDKLSTFEVHPKTALRVAPCSGNGTISDFGPAATEDNWVCCDKCQKWRLLPLGKNPNDLPEKWLCSMLNWLNGMNRCSFSEEETTNAVLALNQIPAPVSQNNLLINPGGVTSKFASVDSQFDQNHLDIGLHAIPSGGKKKAFRDGSTPLPNSIKKSVQSSLTNGSLNGVNQPMVSETDFLKLSKSSDLAAEKYKHKQKEKHRVDNCSNGGDPRQSKMKGKRDPEQDLFRASKKIRTESLQEDWVSDPVNIEKVGPSSSNGLPKNTGRSSSKDQVQVPARKPKEDVPISMDDVPMDMGNQIDIEVGKKRKVKGSHDAQANPCELSNMGHSLQKSRILAKEEFSENEYRKEKKARISRSDEKEASASKGSSKSNKKGSCRKNKQLRQDVGSTVSQRSLDGMDSLKRDSRSLHPSVAATSSSSKVSGSHKAKVNVHDTKGSPVESVSSSPLRVPKPGGQRRCSDGEDDGGSDRCVTAKKDKILDVAHHGSLESSVLDFQEKDLSHVSGGKAKQQIMPSPNVINHHSANGGADYLGQDSRCPVETTSSDRCCKDNRQHEYHYHVNGSNPRKSGKGSSSRSKDKNRCLNSELDNGKVMVSDSINVRAPSYEEKPTDGKVKIEEKVGVRSDESEKRYVDKKDPTGVLSSESSKKESRSKFQVHNGPDSKAHAISSDDMACTPKQILPLDCEAVSGRGKSPSLPPFRVAPNDTTSHCPLPVSGTQKGNGAKISVFNASDSDNALKTQKQIRNVDQTNGTCNHSSRDPLSNEHRGRDLDAPSPVKRDSSSQAATNALKEAKNLKHLADRLKSSGSNLESTKLYFEAALKFLHGASLLETCSSESAKTGEMIQSIKVYSSTAKLCEFCAHEYEKSKDMAAAALAYKCMEVAYMRVIYSSHADANNDQHELQKALHMFPPGESPSSSASDVDNLHHPATVDKGFSAKDAPQVTGSHVIAARNRPTFLRLLNFAQDVNFAMEASRKSRIAFVAANVSLGETQHREGLSSIKKALDFYFQDIEGLLRLVRLAIEAISR